MLGRSDASYFRRAALARSRQPRAVLTRTGDAMNCLGLFKMPAQVHPARLLGLGTCGGRSLVQQRLLPCITCSEANRRLPANSDTSHRGSGSACRAVIVRALKASSFTPFYKAPFQSRLVLIVMRPKVTYRPAILGLFDSICLLWQCDGHDEVRLVLTRVEREPLRSDQPVRCGNKAVQPVAGCEQPLHVEQEQIRARL